MSADIQEGVYLPSPPPGYEDRVLAHIGGNEIARSGNLGFVAGEKPATGKYFLQFLLLDLRVRENSGTKDSIAGVYQGFNIGHHEKPPPSIIYQHLPSWIATTACPRRLM